MDYKAWLGALAVVVGFIGYVPYFRNIFKGKTKPHAFSWLVWGVLTGIAFFAQISSDGGAGTWVTGFSAVICIVIFLIALWRGTKTFPLVDWLSLAGAGVALTLWAVTNSPLGAVVLISIIDALGFIPTFRKSYLRPHEETMFTYAMSGIKFFFGIIALQSFSATTILYPASIILTNIVFIAMLVMRRRQMAGA